MSTCISRQGEYSDHESDADFFCTRCYHLDEEAIRGHIETLTVRAVEAERKLAAAEAVAARAKVKR